MKKGIRDFVALTFACLLFTTASVVAQGTAFTYQGQLRASNDFASGSYDLSFAVYGTSTAGGIVAGPITNTAISMSNGIFTTMLDFGTNVFTGSNLWLEIGVRTNGDGGFVILTPRQPVTPTPYAIYSLTAATVPNGAIGSAQIAPGAVGPAQLATGVTGAQIIFNTSVFIVPTNVNFVFVTLVGGGGGGGAGDQMAGGFGGDNYGGGGGGGGGIILNYPVVVTPGGSYTVTIGAGGAGAPAGATGGSPPWSGHAGSSGGTTDFGGLIHAYGGNGGYGGTGINQGGGGEGGIGGATTVASPLANLGYTGNTGGVRGNDNSFVGGAGANSPFGQGGGAANGANANGGSATGYGAGGGGGAPSDNNNGTGGIGSAGFAIIRYP